MGKILIIKDTNFSEVSVEKVNILQKVYLTGDVLDGYYIHKNPSIERADGSQCIRYNVSEYISKNIYVVISGIQDEELCYNGFFNGTTFVGSIGKPGIYASLPMWIEESDCPVSGIIPNNSQYFIINKYLLSGRLDIEVTVYVYV